MLTAFYLLGSIIFTLVWQLAVRPDASHKTRALNVFGATVICLFAGLALAITTHDRLLSAFMILATIAFMDGWSTRLDVFAPSLARPAAHPHGNEQFMEEYDAPAPHLTIV